MKSRLMGFLIILSIVTANAAPVIVTEDAMNKYAVDAQITGSFAPVTLDAVRNEHELFQVLFYADGEPVNAGKLEISSLSGPDNSLIDTENIRLRRAHYSTLKENVRKIETLPDALLPYAADFTVPAGHAQAIYVDIFIPKETQPGTYTGTITANADEKKVETTLTVHVRNLELPDMPSFESAFAIWRGEQLSFAYPDLAPNDPSFQILYENLYWFLVDYRLMPDDLPVAVDSPESDKYLRSGRVNAFRIPYNPDHPDQLIQLCDNLRQRGLLDMGYIYTLDEPGGSEYQKCYDYGKQLHATVPDVRWLLTINTTHNQLLEEVVNIWSPILTMYDYDYHTERRRLGDKVWWYTCVYPQHPYPTYLINDYGLSPRILSWQQAKYNVDGILYWCVNIWSKYNLEKKRYESRDIWNDPSAFPNSNGDGYLIYPPEEITGEPIPSLRLEMIRQGGEDIDLLNLLKEEVDALSLEYRTTGYTGADRVYELVNRISENKTDFTKNPEDLQTLRREVLDEIEALKYGVPALWISSRPEGKLKPGETVEYELHVPFGAAVTVAATANGISRELPLRRDGSTCFFTLETITADTAVAATIQAAGKSSTYIRKYLYISETDQPVDLLNWQQDSDVKKLELENVELIPVAGTTVKGFRFLPNVEFPSVYMDLPLENSNSYKFLSLDVSNPSQTESVSAVLKYHTPQGAIDGNPIEIGPGRRATLAFRFNPEDSQPEEAIKRLQFWMFQDSRAHDLVINRITLHTVIPEADNLK